MRTTERGSAPFIRVIVFAALGLLLSRLFDVAWQWVGLCFVVCGVVAWLLRSREGWLANAYLWVSVVLFFFAVGELHTPQSHLPTGRRVALVGQVSEPPYTVGRWQRTTLDVGYYRGADFPTFSDSPSSQSQKVSPTSQGGDDYSGLSDNEPSNSSSEKQNKPNLGFTTNYEKSVGDDSGNSLEILAQNEADDQRWQRVGESVMLYVDTCYHNIEVGLQIAFKGWFNPIDTLNSSYANLMRMRGLHGRVYLTPGNLLWRSPHISRTPTYYASKMQKTSIERIERLNLSPNNKAVVTAMTAGDKRSVDYELRGSYSLTGAAHLLAVSGLHVGIVFVLINLLLYLLPIFRYGHIAKNIVAIVAIWLYAMSAGLAPSVIRAALMFSFAQFALATSIRRNGLNIMLGSAVIMLAINPNYATDPSFLLSYAAVVAIMLFFSPLYRLCALKIDWKRPKLWRRVVNSLISVLVVGFVATLGTAPLVAYWFGNFPIVGLLLNPVVIFTAHIIVMFGVLWVIMPIGLLNPLFSWLLNSAAGVQNWVVERSAEWSWASVAAQPPLWVVVVIYCFYILLALYLQSREREVAPFRLE